MANEMKSLTLNDKTYDSFPDQKAREAVTMGVRFDKQTLTAEQQAQARENLGIEDAPINPAVPTVPTEAVLYVEQTLTEEQQEQARKNIGVTGSSEVFNSILELLKHAAYDSDMSGSLDKLETLIHTGKPVYKWVVGLNGSYVSGTNEALLNQNNVRRAMCVATGTGIPMTYGSDYQPTEMSPYSPVVIPDGAVSVTVKCPGFYISFNELKLVDGKWYRLFNTDTDPAAGADEVTYTFRKAEASGLYIKLRYPDESIISDVPGIPDITFNYEPIQPDDDGTYKWVVGLNGSYVSGTQEAILTVNNPHRAMCVAENTGVPLYYGANYVATEVSPYSPVVIPEGAVSITVRCQGHKISFNELKLVDGKWYRLLSADTDPVADEVTYTFKKAEASGLFIKLRTASETNFVEEPEKPDIVFNY